jgi:hypothetical protein
VVAAREQTGNVLRNTAFNPLPYNDDAVGGSMIEASLMPGVQYYMITSALNSSVSAEGDGGPFVGRYSNVITPLGNGSVTLGLVPEPTTALVLGTLASVLLRRRRP